MTDCREARDLLQDELDGRISPADAERLAAHLVVCAECADARGRLAALRATFRAVPRPAAPQGFKSGVMSSLPKGRVLNLPRTLGWIAAIAATVVVAVTLVPRKGPAETGVVATADRAAHKNASAPAAAAGAPQVAREEKAQWASKSEGDKRDETDKDSTKTRGGADAGRIEGNVDRLAAQSKKLADVAAPTTRYVVFRTAAAADAFARDLAAAAVARRGDDARPSGGLVPPPAPAPATSPPPRAKVERAADEERAKDDAAQGGRARGKGAGPPADGRADEPLAKSAPVALRLVAVVPMTADLLDLAERAAKAGGAIASLPQTSQYRQLFFAKKPADSVARREAGGGGGGAAEGARKAADEPLDRDEKADAREKNNEAPGAAQGPPQTAAFQVVIVLDETAPAEGKSVS